MTNEEALDELNVIYERLSHPEDCEQGVYSFRDGDYLEALDKAIKALEQNPYKDFCEFVAKMVLRDDFEENAGANAEFLCRKLSKLGIVKANEDEWVLVESEDEE